MNKRISLEFKVPQKFAISRELIRQFFFPATKEVATTLEFAWREELYNIDAVASGVTERAIKSKAFESYTAKGDKTVSGKVASRSSLQFVGMAFGVGERVNITLNVLETGRRKGAKMPPLAPILEWMAIRGIPSYVPKGVKDLESYKRRIAFLIRRKIAIRGIAGRRPARIARRKAQAEVYAIYMKARDRFVEFFNTPQSERRLTKWQ